MPSFWTIAAASNTARACISEISGNPMPSRQPRKPSIGIELVELLDARMNSLDGESQLFREIGLLLRRVRQELVQRRVEEPDRRRVSLQRAEDAGEIVALVRQQFGQRLLPRLERVGEDHLAHRVDAVALEEHVLGPAEADADGAERNRLARLLWFVRVGAHAASVTQRSHHFISC